MPVDTIIGKPLMIKYIDYFARPQFAASGDDWLYKSRLLVGIVLTYLLVIAAFGLFFALFPGTPIEERLAGLIPVLTLGGIFAAVLFILRKRGLYRLCGYIVIGGTYLGIAAGVYMTGGPLDTPSGALLLLPVFLAFCLLSLREGIVWALLVFSVTVSGMIATAYGYQFPMVTADDRMSLTRGFNWVMAFISLVSLVIVYESVNTRLRRERNEERERYRYVIDVARQSNLLSETVDAMNLSGSGLLDAAISQKAAIEELATTSEQLGATAEQNNSLAASARQSIMEAEEYLNLSSADILLLVESMQTIEQYSDKIQKITDVINEIAWQTNLLSLNAMIEASRAGEGNNGFKVVAQEVKKLAARSADAANDINELLLNNVKSVKKGAELSQAMQARFGEIVSKFQPLSFTIQNVSDASLEQVQAIRQISAGLDNIDQAISRNQQMATQIAEMAIKLQGNADTLMSAIETLRK